MPIMDGYECTQKIRDLEKTIQFNIITEEKAFVVGLSGHSTEAYKNKGYQSGMNDFSKYFIIIILYFLSGKTY